ncbi:MAG: hypothetical protein KC503_29455 [Myxococcales bacterium]|nr:hypothetical protein [Myxococcales bacterium]
MPPTVFSYMVKTTECANCGAPVTGKIGTSVRCEYCSTVNALRERRQDTAVAASNLSEPARIAQLRAQVISPDDPALPQPPMGYEQVVMGAITDPAQRQSALATLRQEWQRVRQQATQYGLTPDIERRVYRLALIMGDWYRLDNEHARARAVLETALDTLTDPTQRDVVRNQLARAALAAGDVEGYAGWIGDVNAQPVHLVADSEYRCSVAKHAASESRWYDVLAVLGRTSLEIPISPHLLLLAYCLRSHALAGTGDQEAAKGQIAEAVARPDVSSEVMRVCWTSTPGPATPLAHAMAGQAGQATGNRGMVIQIGGLGGLILKSMGHSAQVQLGGARPRVRSSSTPQQANASKVILIVVISIVLTTMIGIGVAVFTFTSTLSDGISKKADEVQKQIGDRLKGLKGLLPPAGDSKKKKKEPPSRSSDDDPSVTPSM